ncbi:MAG: tRNA dihydrouridine(20/20a) synthase DusA [Gammaproteobacteria bacterium]|nr:tRNA dihydrouridine(20/20a) synthase DusA [Gammaproteobacteria bacterium]
MPDSGRHGSVLVAPMMDWTDRHCRYFLRLLSPGAMLYTEMVTAAAIHHGDYAALLEFDASQHPVALQIGGSDPVLMAEAARRGAEFAYDEININVGCPSDRVQSGQFGACLMAHPEVVAECLRAMRSEAEVPVTVKTRIGIDDEDSYEFLKGFVDIQREAGCHKFIVHARVAILEGLSPKENRSVPPLRYERVFQLKQDLPELEIVLNGGIKTVEQVDEVLKNVDGVMIGRQAYHDPYFLAHLEQYFNPGWSLPDRHRVVLQMIPYIEGELARGERLGRITRHMLGLFTGQPGARTWRRYISENAFKDGAGPEVLIDALDKMPVAA